jgi:hypothetical protein
MWRGPRRLVFGTRMVSDPSKEPLMQHYESYVAEAQARQRRRMALGAVGAVMLAAAGLAALLVFDGSASPAADSTAQQPSTTSERTAASGGPADFR